MVQKNYSQYLNNVPLKNKSVHISSHVYKIATDLQTTETQKGENRMMSPDIQHSFTNQNYLQNELAESYEKMINVKRNIIKDQINAYPKANNKDAHSIGLGFVLETKKLTE